MLDSGVSPKATASLCIVRDTRVDLSVSAIDAFEDKWKVGRVEISFAPQDVATLNKAVSENGGKMMVLLRGEGAVLEFKILRVARERSLMLSGFDLPEAEAIKQAVVSAT
jgi:hypothetical protein